MPPPAQGFILDKKIGVGQPKRIENAKVLVANTPMDTDKIKMYGARVRVDSMAKVAEIEQSEKEKMKSKCDKIIAQGINVFINRQLIYNYPEEIFADAGIMSIEHAGMRPCCLLPSVCCLLFVAYRPGRVQPGCCRFTLPMLASCPLSTRVRAPVGCCLLFVAYHPLAVLGSPLCRRWHRDHRALGTRSCCLLRLTLTVVFLFLLRQTTWYRFVRYTV